MRKMVLAAALVPLIAGGCVRTVTHVVTTPVRVAGKVVGGPKSRDAKWVREQRKRNDALRNDCKHHRADPADCSRLAGMRR